jgi:hypothetical protein
MIEDAVLSATLHAYSLQLDVTICCVAASECFGVRPTTNHITSKIVYLTNRMGCWSGYCITSLHPLHMNFATTLPTAEP